MSPASLACLVAGAALIVIGAVRARDPYRRYIALKAQDENIARYEAWRGGVRSDGKTGASVAMSILRRQARIGAGIALVGVALVAVGFVVR